MPVASRLPVYEELLADGEYGDGFEPGDIETLSVASRRRLACQSLRRARSARS